MGRMPRLLLTAIFATAFATAANADLSTNAEHALLMDAGSGQVLWQKDGFVSMPPASMSKLMTIELLFQRMKDSRVKLTDTFPVSERAWRTQGSKSFVMVGSRIPVQDLIRGVVIQSGNDACIVIAEALGGTVEGFVAMMNKRAKELGLAKSHFVNPDGLPDPPGQLMSAYDLAKLSRHLVRDYPAYYHFFGEKSFVWGGITQPNRNLVLDKLPGADGLKTGHTDESGYGVTASAVRNGQRFILVLNGLRYPAGTNDWFAERYRADEAARILELAFREFRQYKLFGPNDIVGQAKTYQGEKETVPLKLGTPLAITMQVDSRAGMKVSLKYDGPVKAPIMKGQQIGTLKVTAPDFPGVEVPVYAAEEVDRAGFFSRVFSGVGRLIFGAKKS
ncbi:MAG: D-alanyl-D-alanine carboxypeptidase [Proteobacteria bacterium]|nr:D-alanyl-D-alanine carboxypeptidase [Pseudomonadota bacterium]